jgi:hypothetical protein
VTRARDEDEEVGAEGDWEDDDMLGLALGSREYKQMGGVLGRVEFGWSNSIRHTMGWKLVGRGWVDAVSCRNEASFIHL